MRPWQPWPPQFAAQLFLEELNRLTADAPLTAPPILPRASKETAYA
jgi:hypothetical protein